MTDWNYVPTPAQVDSGPDLCERRQREGPTRPRVAVIGAGIAGLTAAHELAERGFEVVVYEPKADERSNKTAVPNFFIPPVKLGGLAASQFSSGEDNRIRRFPSRHREAAGPPPPAVDPRYRSQLVPGEHGFRFFPSYYMHLWDTLKRIPIYEPRVEGNPAARPLPNSLGVTVDEMAQTDWFQIRWMPTHRTVYDNVTSVTAQAVTTPDGRPSLILPRISPTTATEWLGQLAQFRELGFSREDLGHFQARLATYMATSSQRRAAELERMSAYDFFVGLDPDTALHDVNYTAEFDLALKQMPKVLAAFDAEWGDARTNLNTFLQLHLPSEHFRQKADGVLNGTTTETWFDHWYVHLTTELGVHFVRAELEGLHVSADGCRIEPRFDWARNDLTRIPGVPVDLAGVLLFALDHDCEKQGCGCGCSGAGALVCLAQLRKKLEEGKEGGELWTRFDEGLVLATMIELLRLAGFSVPRLGTGCEFARLLSRLESESGGAWKALRQLAVERLEFLEKRGTDVALREVFSTSSGEEYKPLADRDARVAAANDEAGRQLGERTEQISSQMAEVYEWLVASGAICEDSAESTIGPPVDEKDWGQRLLNSHPLRKYAAVRKNRRARLYDWANAAREVICETEHRHPFEYVVLAVDAKAAERVTRPLRECDGRSGCGCSPGSLGGGIAELDGFYSVPPPAHRPRPTRAHPRRRSLRDQLDARTRDELETLFLARLDFGGQREVFDFVMTLNERREGLQLARAWGVEAPDGLGNQDLHRELMQIGSIAPSRRGLQSIPRAEQELRSSLATTWSARRRDLALMTRRDIAQALIPLDRRGILPLDIVNDERAVKESIKRFLRSRDTGHRRRRNRLVRRCRDLVRDPVRDEEDACDVVDQLDVDELRHLLLRDRRLDDVGMERWDRFQTMAGVQFFFDTEFQLVTGHVYYSGTDWALTSINQTGLWARQPTVDRSRFASVLSVIVGDWRTPSERLATDGFPRGRTAAECTTGELAAEVWDQICEALANDNDRLERAQVFPEPIWYSVDQYLRLPDAEDDCIEPVNTAPYLVPIVDDWHRRPGGYPWNPHGRSISYTREDDEQQRARHVWMADHGGYEVYWNSLVFAGTWTKTFTRMTTMESACESARHAINAILDHWVSEQSAGWDGDRDTRPAEHVGLRWRLPDDYVGKDGIYPIRQPTPAGDYCLIFDVENDEFADLRPTRLLDERYAAADLDHPWTLLGVDLKSWSSMPGLGYGNGAGLPMNPFSPDVVSWWIDRVQAMRHFADALGQRVEPSKSIVDRLAAAETDPERQGPPGWVQHLPQAPARAPW